MYKNNAEAYYFKVLILNKKGEFSKAINFIETALELNPAKAKYYAQAAVSNMGREFYNDAMLYIKEAIEIEPDELNYKKLASEIAKKAGNEQEARFWNLIVNGTESIIKDTKRL